MLCSKRGKRESALHRLFDVSALPGFQSIPFIDGDNQRSPAIDGKTKQGQILVGQPIAGIDNQHHHVCLFRSLPML